MRPAPLPRRFLIVAGAVALAGALIPATAWAGGQHLMT
jgi:hypothetical protein